MKAETKPKTRKKKSKSPAEEKSWNANKQSNGERVKILIRNNIKK